MSKLRTILARRRGPIGFAAGVLVAGLVAGTGVAIAAIPSTTTSTFTACVNKSSGVVRMIDYQAGKRCTSRELAVSWGKGYRYRGTWTPATVYLAQDVVVVNGSSYVAKLTSRAKSPTRYTAYWGLLSARGAQGLVGPAGPAGPAGTARGFALVDPSGAISRSSGNVSVSKVGTGDYCVAVAGVDASQSVAVVTPDYRHSDTNVAAPGSTAQIEIDSGSTVCPATSFNVVTLVADQTAPIGVFWDDQGFYFMVG
jgi:hypothetical protein